MIKFNKGITINGDLITNDKIKNGEKPVKNTTYEGYWFGKELTEKILSIERELDSNVYTQSRCEKMKSKCCKMLAVFMYTLTFHDKPYCEDIWICTKCLENCGVE